MKLFLYELRKLSNTRFVMACIAALLILNIFLCAYTINTPNPLPDEIAEEVYNLYLRDAQYVEDIHAAWQGDFLEYEERYLSFVKRGGIEPILPVNDWLPDGMSDAQLYDKLYADVNRPETFRSSIADVVKSALSSKISLEDSGAAASYEYRYQQEIIDRYTALHDQVYIGFEYTRGYDVYLTCRIPLFLSIIASTLISSYFYTTERANASLALIRCTKKGRLPLTRTKIAAAYLSVFTFLAVSQLTALLIVGSRIGFSSPYNSIQVFEFFTYCPYQITALQACMLDFLLKSVCLFVITSVFILAASKTDYLTACAVNIGISAAVVGIYYITGSYPTGLPHLLNPLTLAFDALLRYRAVNLFGVPYSSTPVVCIAFLIAAVICILTSGILFTRGTGKTITFSHKIKLPKRTQTHREGSFVPSLSLCHHELYKVLSNRAVLVSILLFAVLTAVMIPSEIGIQTTDEIKLRDYIQSSLYGEISDEKFSFVHSEGVRLSDAYLHYNETVDAYYQGQLSLDEFKPIADEHAYADSRKNAYEKLRLYAEYLSEHSENNGLWFVYETGWTALFSDYNMILIILVICFAVSRIVGTEYVSFTSSGGFHQILRTTASGRAVTFRCKAQIITGTVFFLHTVQYVFRTVYIHCVYILSGCVAPLKSLPIFADHVLGDCSIVIYLLLHYLYQLVMLVFLGFLVMGLTYIFRRGFIAFISVITCALLPTLMEYLGITIPDFLSFTTLMNLTDMTILPITVSTMIFSATSLTITIFSYRKFSCNQ